LQEFQEHHVAHAEAERGQIIRSIHRVYKPNEVWLVASGGILFVAFPRLLAVGLSGFYLALMIVLSSTVELE